MGDWLSELEAKKKRELIESQQTTKKWQNKSRKEAAYENKSYENNKDKIEKVYENIENYVRRATSMKFNVTVRRGTTGSLHIKPQEHSPKGYPEIYIKPYGIGFKLTFMASMEYEERRISIYRVSDRVIGEWVKYVADHYGGYKVLKRSNYYAIGVFILGLLMLTYSYKIAGGTGVFAMLLVTGFLTYRASKTYI